MVATAEASEWIVRFAALVPPAGRVLDVAAGSGRHTRFFLDRGHPVTAVDRDTSGLADLKDDPAFESLEFDLETGAPWPLPGRQFEAVVVTNYLHRPSPPRHRRRRRRHGGVLLYETFARGQERFGRPQNPDFLLTPGELLDAARPALQVIAYEDLILDGPSPRAVQRIAARNVGG